MYRVRGWYPRACSPGLETLLLILYQVGQWFNSRAWEWSVPELWGSGNFLGHLGILRGLQGCTGLCLMLEKTGIKPSQMYPNHCTVPGLCLSSSPPQYLNCFFQILLKIILTHFWIMTKTTNPTFFLYSFRKFFQLPLSYFICSHIWGERGFGPYPMVIWVYSCNVARDHSYQRTR